MSGSREERWETIIAFAIVGVIAVVVVAMLTDGFGLRREPAPQHRGVDARMLTGDDPSLGDADAPVVVVEFASFSSPNSRRIARDLLPRVREAYIDEGLVYWVYRDFPLLGVHPFGVEAAVAAECAHAQGRFWEYHDLLIDREDLSEPALFSLARRIDGLDVAAFDACLIDRVFLAEVELDLQQGRVAGVQGTPTLFINNETIVGALSFEEFSVIVDRQLTAVG